MGRAGPGQAEPAPAGTKRPWPGGSSPRTSARPLGHAGEPAGAGFPVWSSTGSNRRETGATSNWRRQQHKSLLPTCPLGSVWFFVSWGRPFFRGDGGRDRAGHDTLDAIVWPPGSQWYLEALRVGYFFDFNLESHSSPTSQSSICRSNSWFKNPLGI